MNWTEEIGACIFDLDGVIVDTAKYHFEAWKKVASAFDIDFTEAFNENLKGVSRADSLTFILDAANVEISKEDFQRTLVKKNEHYLDLISGMNKTEILPGVLPYLILLAKSGTGIALGSASKNAVTILKSLEIIEFFDIISDGNSVKKGKPDPEVFLNCSEFYNISPKKCVVFEDSIKGIEAAINGGFKSVGIGDSQTLKAANVVYHSFETRTPEELISLY